MKIGIIGSGFSGLSAAAYLAKAGHQVEVFEKHIQPGGRARQFETHNGFKFDMGPSWYWMPDIIENFFNDFNKKSSDYYELKSLNPQFEMVFETNSLNVPESYKDLRTLFEEIEPGAGNQFDKFMEAAKYKYQVGMQDFVSKPSLSWTEFISPKIAKSALRLDLLKNFRDYVAKYFKNPQLKTLMEFPVIFLGASPQNIPALYSLMNYGGYALGTWYPKGGFYEIIKAMHNVAQENGAHFNFNSNVSKIVCKNGQVSGIEVNGQTQYFDAVIASSDYHHSETLLDPDLRNYTESYWLEKTFAPSSLIYYLGFDREIPNLKHHTLFFENDLDEHIDTIYKTKSWPDKPLFYACAPSKSDDNIAPQGCENVFLLMPLATGIEDGENIREKYFNEMISRLEKHTQTQNLRNHIVYKKSYCISDFKKDYNAYQGNAYGLANTLKQTAIFKPRVVNKKVKNLYYTGQLTVPGPGVPPSIISGKIVATLILSNK